MNRSRITPFLLASLTFVVAGCGSGPASLKTEHGAGRVRGDSNPRSPVTTSTAQVQSASTTTGPPSTSRTTSTPPTSPSALEYGPGPQATYAIQAQPPPGSCRYTYVGRDPLPDPRCTPGALNPQVTQGTIGSTICESGYTSSIRPPESVTEPEKRGSASAYGYAGPFSTAEYDHLVPLELGGDPNDPANLWVEPNDNPNATSTANSKDELEDRLNSLVCSGQLPLATAQLAIASNWVAAYRTYVGSQAAPSTTNVSSPPAGGADSCTATAAPANDGYSGDYEVSVTSNQPNEKATASDARDSWSDETDSSGFVKILLYYVSPGEQIDVTVGAASCSTTA